MDGNPTLTVHATAHAFRAAINLNSMLWLSSENKTFFQSSTVQFVCFFAHLSLFFCILRVKSCFFCGLLDFLPAEMSRLLMRDALISTPDEVKSFCRSLLVFLGSSLLFLMRYESSFGVVFRFRPYFPFRLGVNDPVSLNCLIILATMVWPTLQILEIYLVDAWQCSWRAKILARFFGERSAIKFWPRANVDSANTEVD